MTSRKFTHRAARQANPHYPCQECGGICTLDTIDGMVLVGQLVVDDSGMLALGPRQTTHSDGLPNPLPAHKPRPTLLQDPRYLALRERMKPAQHGPAREDTR